MVHSVIIPHSFRKQQKLRFINCCNAVSCLSACNHKSTANLIGSLYCSLMCSNQLHQQNDSHNWTKLIPSVFRIARGSGRGGTALRYETLQKKALLLCYGDLKGNLKRKKKSFDYILLVIKRNCIAPDRPRSLLLSTQTVGSGIWFNCGLWRKSFESEKSYTMYGNNA